MMEPHPLPYVTDDTGDICGRRREDGTVEAFDPAEFGWHGKAPRARLSPEDRRSLDEIRTLPNFSVTVERGVQFVPGPRPRRPQWMNWKNGAAPPAVAESRGGIGGTHPHHDRLTGALGNAVRRLLARPDRSPFIVHDLVGGQRIIIEHQPPDGPVQGPISESQPLPYVTDDRGDICGRRREDGTVEAFDPAEFGWQGKAPRARLSPEDRRSREEIRRLPDFSVTEEPGDQFVPGPRPPRPQWMKWKNGAAPPAVAESRGGIGGTHPHHDRLTDALGNAVRRLLARPDRSPFIVHDLVGGQRIFVQYKPPPLDPDGKGTVYVLTDGDAFKIGHTKGQVAARANALQTGNPRQIQPVARVTPASRETEVRLRAEFSQLRRRREWFERAPLERLAADSGGWEELLRRRLPPGNWTITVDDAYA